VRFGAVTTASSNESSKTDGEASSEHPLRQEMTIPERVNETEPSAAPIDAKSDVDALADEEADSLPSQPIHAATQ
jgi:hypothetical protein